MPACLTQNVRDDLRLLRPVQRNDSGRIRARLLRDDGRRSLVGSVPHDPVAGQRRPPHLRQPSGTAAAAAGSEYFWKY